MHLNCQSHCSIVLRHDRQREETKMAAALIKLPLIGSKRERQDIYLRDLQFYNLHY